MDPFKTLLLDTPTVISGDGTGFLQSSNNLGDVDDAASSRTNLDVYSKAEVNTNKFIKQDSGFAISDGFTTDSAERVQYGAIGDVAGLPVTFVIEFVVPTSNPAATAFVFNLGADATRSILPHSLNFNLNTSGSLNVTGFGSTSTSNNRGFVYSTFRADYSGQSVRISIAFPEGDSTTNPTIYINGEDKTSSFSLTTNGTPPNWMDASLNTTWFLSGYNWPAGRAPYSRVIVGALSDTEAAAYTAGMPLEQAAPWTRFAGSAVAIYETDFSSGTGWTLATDTAITGGELVFTANGTDRSAYRSDSVLSPFVGKKVLFAFDADSSGTIRLVNSAAAAITEEYGLDDINIVSGRNYLSGTILSAGSSTWGIRFRNAGGSVSLDNLTVVPLGPLDRPIYQPALATDDALGRFSRRLVGMTPVSSKSDFRIIGNTATSGNEQVLSGAVLEDADAVVDSVEFDTDGTPTITLGSASGGAQYVASTTLSAGLNADETLVTRKAASTALWVGSNATSAVRTYVSGHKINGV